jgi:RHS repeat-associated protein
MNIKIKHKIIITSCLMCCNMVASIGQNIVRPKIAGPNGLWVNSYNGVLFFGQTDMETQNTQMPMQLRFYYNSSSAETDLGYGLGFTLGCEMRYSINEIDGVVITTGDGRSDTYAKYGKEYQAPAGVFGKVEEYAYNKFVLTEKTGEKYYFDDAVYGRMTSMIDRNGNQTTLTYTDSLLTQIRDAVGHTITLSYSDGLLVSASANFHNGSVTYEYDGLHRLKKRTDAMGNSTLYGYDKRNRINEITDANGNKTLIAYNAGGMVSRMKTDVSDKSIRYEGNRTVFVDYTAPQNEYSYYTWDDAGRVVEKVGLCCGMQSKMEYDDNDNVVKRTDANGNVTTYTYDDRGNMLSVTDALGNSERYTYDTDFNRMVSFTDKNGHSYRFVYDGKGNLASLSGPIGFGCSYTYNDKGWRLTATDANGNVTQMTYNADGTTQKEMNAAGFTTSYVYDSCGNIISMTDGRNNTATYSYDKNNRITSQTDALGHTTTVSYDKVGNIVRVKNAQNRIQAYTYDALGNVLTKTDAKGGVYTYTYDGKGNVLSVKDPMGILQSYTWNDKNKLLSHTNGEGEVTAYDYDAKGNLIAVFRPNGNVVSYSYDRLDRIEEMSDNMGIIAKYAYDGNGNQLSVTDGLNRTTTYTYDALNRRTSEVLPSGDATKYTYDGNSNLLTVTDANGNSATFTYSSLNQQLTQTDALNAKTRFEYDGNGNMTRVVDAKGNATAYAYDALNHNTVITFANGGSLQYGYDELGNVVASKDRAGHEIKYTYDPVGNLLVKTYSDGTMDKYTYDGNSRMLSAVNRDAAVSFAYDRADRLLSETLNGKVTGYSYDVAAGRRTVTYPSGLKVEEQLNARNFITGILQNGDEMVTMAYNVAGEKISQGYANGITTTYTYNENGWLSAVVADHDVMSFEMAYDHVGNLIGRKNLLDAGSSESYGYDIVGRITSFRRGDTVDKSYQFDLLGNRIKVLENGVATNYTVNNVNAYTNITGGLKLNPTYDDNGNLLNDDKHTYVYDDNNKHTVVKGGKTTSFAYDALGRRISVKTDEGTSCYYYLNDRIGEVTTSDGTISYIYGNDVDETLLMKKEDACYFYHVDQLASTVAVTDKEGKLVERTLYDIYGTPTFIKGDTGERMTESCIGNIKLFSGREYDRESGTYYFRARNLICSIGRFMQKDPLRYIDGLNDYSYVNNSAVSNVDNYGYAGDPMPIIYGLGKFGALTLRSRGVILETTVDLSKNQAVVGEIAGFYSNTILKANGALKGTSVGVGVGNVVDVIAADGSGPGRGQQVGAFVGGIAGGFAAQWALGGTTAAIGLAVGGIPGAVVGFGIGMAVGFVGSQLGEMVGGEAGKLFDEWWKQNHSAESSSNCDSPAYPNMPL